MAAPEAGDDQRVAVADSPARAPSWDAGASLRLRILRAQLEVETLELDANVTGTTRTGKSINYKGIKAEQVVAKAKAVLLRHGVLYTTEATERVTDGNKTAVYLRGHFENVDDPSDCIVRGAWGEGTDYNDKGTAKAITNANKTLLVRTLNMGTIDFEETEAVEHNPEARPAAIRNAEATSIIAIKTWADSYKHALDGCKTTSELRTVRAENAHMMNHPDVAQITKDYFTDKIAALEGALEDDIPPRPAPAPRGAKNRIAATHGGGTA